MWSANFQKVLPKLYPCRVKCCSSKISSSNFSTSALQIVLLALTMKLTLRVLSGFP